MKTETEKLAIQKPWEHDYMVLSRCKQDLEYYFRNGKGFDGHLYYGGIKQQITKMIEIWKSLPYKPEWLRATELIKFKKQSLGT